MTTLFAVEHPALSEVPPAEVDFLGALLRELAKDARRNGRASLAFRDYTLTAQRESLGAILVAVSWSITRGGRLLARDTAIQYR